MFIIKEKIYMLQLLPSSDILTPNTSNPQKAVEIINSYIDRYHCENIDVDISFMNILDACYVTTMCSTKHYIKYPQGKINWKVSSDLINDFTGKLSLGNDRYLIQKGKHIAVDLNFGNQLRNKQFVKSI